MSHDSGSKTEKPTPKRIEDARKQGQVAKSADFNSAIVLIAATGALAFVGPYTVSTLYGMMRHTFSHLPQQALSEASFLELITDAVQSTIWLLLPLMLTIMVLGALSNLVQVKPLFTMQAIQPKPDKINPINGFKRLWAMRSVVEVVKALIKMAIIGASAWIVINNHLAELMILGGQEVPVAWGAIVGVMGEVALWCCVCFFIMGLADWWYQSWEMEKQLRMSRQEIRDERKNQEGDPMLKNRIRQMGIKLAKTRQLAAVPMADVVITNPTHFAIALKYDPDVAPAPIVVAKGKDLFAQKIKEVAKEHNVPMVENKPLARALYPVVEVEAMIPPDLFVAVAEVLAYVFARNKGRKLPSGKNKQKPAGVTS